MNQNQERADRATQALQAAIISGGYDPEYAIADLLCDLKHAGHDIEDLCNRALGHFAAESTTMKYTVTQTRIESTMQVPPRIREAINNLVGQVGEDEENGRLVDECTLSDCDAISEWLYTERAEQTTA
jgi:hypothetical protein